MESLNLKIYVFTMKLDMEIIVCTPFVYPMLSVLAALGMLPIRAPEMNSLIPSRREQAPGLGHAIRVIACLQKVAASKVALNKCN
jgi:hypothetical protein